MGLAQWMRALLRYLIVFPLILHSVQCADTCSAIQQAYPDIAVLFPGYSEYNITAGEYWSLGCSAQRPSCVILPRSAQQMSNAVKVLRQNNEPFAVKSGGHSPNCFASINGGPLLATRYLNEVTYNPTTRTVRVGPGNHWHNVTAALQGTGMSVVGGRMGEVGVGGYMLGGGLSFLSSQYGWAANQVVEYEVVLANSSIVRVSNSNHPDLFAALKGGGGSFGIVTSFTLRAFPQGQVWGGVRVYTSGKTQDLLAAIRDFTEYYPDPKAAIIATAELTGYNLLDIWIVFFFYDGPAPPDNVFANFTAISHLIDMTKTRSYHDMMLFDNNFVFKNSIYTIATETTPLPNKTVGTQVMEGFYNSWHEKAASVKSIPGVVASIAFQPLPKMITQRSKEYGGVVMDFDESKDYIIFELDYSYWYGKDDQQIDDIVQKTYGGLGAKVKEFTQQGLLPEAHLPLFMNDAYFRQDYWGRLKDTSAYKQTKNKYDGQAYLQSKTKGFRI